MVYVARYAHQGREEMRRWAWSDFQAWVRQVSVIVKRENEAT